MTESSFLPLHLRCVWLGDRPIPWRFRHGTSSHPRETALNLQEVSFSEDDRRINAGLVPGFSRPETTTPPEFLLQNAQSFDTYMRKVVQGMIDEGLDVTFEDDLTRRYLSALLPDLTTSPSPPRNTPPETGPASPRDRTTDTSEPAQGARLATDGDDDGVEVISDTPCNGEL